MVTDFQKIKHAIETALNAGKKNFIIYPYGEYGVLTKRILNDSFGISECFIIDNNLSKFNPKIKSLDFFAEIDISSYTVLFNSANPDVRVLSRKDLERYFASDNIVDIFKVSKEHEEDRYTSSGKYSYGSLCDHWLVESVGAFCSFADGCDVVQNHPVDCVSTHPFLYYDSEVNHVILYRYDECKNMGWYFPGVQPRGGGCSR